MHFVRCSCGRESASALDAHAICMFLTATVLRPPPPGSPYAAERRVFEEYDRPYVESPAANAALAATLEKCDYQALLKRVDEGYCSWKKPSVLLFGAADPFVDLSSAFSFLETKRTNMKVWQSG